VQRDKSILKKSKWLIKTLEELRVEFKTIQELRVEFNRIDGVKIKSQRLRRKFIRGKNNIVMWEYMIMISITISRLTIIHES
jgi:hypothetical protein